MLIKERAEYRSKSKPITLKKSQFVRDAVEIMSDKNFGCVVIVNSKNEVEGIVSERDLMRRVLNKKLDPDKTKLEEIMTTEVKLAYEDDKVIDWLQVMSNERFRHLPVIDKNNKLVNVMSQGDFVSYTWPSLLSNVKDKTKEAISLWYQIPLIVFSLLVYALLVNFLNPK